MRLLLLVGLNHHGVLTPEGVRLFLVQILLIPIGRKAAFGERRYLFAKCLIRCIELEIHDSLPAVVRGFGATPGPILSNVRAFRG